jgi:hypothetical protein
LLEKVLALELAAIDGLTELAMPYGLRLPAGGTLDVLVQLESALFTDLRAFRHLLSLGYVPQAAQLYRSIIICVCKARICLVDPTFATRLASDESVRDSDILRLYSETMATGSNQELSAHVVLVPIREEYARASAIAHKRWSASSYQQTVNADGDLTIKRDPPAFGFRDRGAELMFVAMMRVTELFEQLIPYLLSEAGADPTEWIARMAAHQRLVAEMDWKWDAGAYGGPRLRTSLRAMPTQEFGRFTRRMRVVGSWQSLADGLTERTIGDPRDGRCRGATSRLDRAATTTSRRAARYSAH